MIPRACCPLESSLQSPLGTQTLTCPSWWSPLFLATSPLCPCPSLSEAQGTDEPGPCPNRQLPRSGTPVCLQPDGQSWGVIPLKGLTDLPRWVSPFPSEQKRGTHACPPGLATLHSSTAARSLFALSLSLLEAGTGVSPSMWGCQLSLGYVWCSEPVMFSFENSVLILRLSRIRKSSSGTSLVVQWLRL